LNFPKVRGAAVNFGKINLSEKAIKKIFIALNALKFLND
jgi:hypothetical protein